ncbi:hypothetical protein ACFX13_005205 [Malus domestica]
MSTGDTLAVKVLASNSTLGQNEFLVLLLGRLFHKNLVNLVGYIVEEVGQYMLLYKYLSNGSLFSHLHEESQKPLCWDLRVDIALDNARGLEYLHFKGIGIPAFWGILFISVSRLTQLPTYSSPFSLTQAVPPVVDLEDDAVRV